MTTRTICEIRRDAKRVSDAVRLDQIYLTALYFDADEQFADSQYRVETSLRVRGERRSESVVVVFSRHESVARKEDMDSDSPTSWRATVDHEARFDVTASVDDVSEDQFMAFAIDVGTGILHPYAREITQSITGRSPFPAFTLGRSKSIWEKNADEVVEIEPTEIQPSESSIDLRPQNSNYLGYNIGR